MIKAFSLTEPRYDQSTFWGRCRHFYSVTDPRTLLCTDKELQRAMNLLQKFKNGTLDRSAITDEDLWQARKIKESMVHPSTEQKLPIPFRFAAFAPCNIPIVAGLLIPNASTASVVFWQWVNQSYNAGVNWFNSSSTEGDDADAVKKNVQMGYAAASVTSVGLAVGLGKVANRLSSSPSASPLMSKVLKIAIPFTAVATAGCVNLLLMRRAELSHGIDVFKESGEAYGKSKEAAKSAISKCCAARVLWSIPILVVPPIIMSQLEKFSFISSNRRIRAVTELAVITAVLAGAVPAALAIFPQRDSILLPMDGDNNNNSSNNKTIRVYYNKGL